MFETTCREGVLRFKRDGTRWFSTGWDGGFWRTSAAYSISVPEGWDSPNIDRYVEDRRRRSGFDVEGPTLLTAIDLEHVRGARLGTVEVYATAGLSNPAALPIQPASDSADQYSGEHAKGGTVNLLVGTSHALDDAPLANLLAVAVEAKVTTLLAETGFPGTTTDAAIIACNPAGEPAEFTGSATRIGAAARACIREAIRASLRARYPNGEYPSTVGDAEHGVVTNERAEVFRL